MLTDENGSVKATYGYNPYGEDDLTMFTGVDKPDSAQPDKAAYNDYRYGGQPWDANTQSYDLGFRDYFPSLGRFLSPDSYNDSVTNKGLVMDTMTNNLYSYAGGNPVDFSDQDGHIPLYNGDDGGDAVQMYVAATGQLYHPSGKGKKASKSQMKRANQHSNSLQARNHKKPKPKPKPKAKAKPKPKPVAKPPAVKCQSYTMSKSGVCVRNATSQDLRRTAQTAKVAGTAFAAGYLMTLGLELGAPIAAFGGGLIAAGFTKAGMSVINFAVGTVKNVVGGVSKSTVSSSKRVGQWMSKNEYNEFVETGVIPRTNVLTKGKGGYIKQANKGDYYVEFDVDSSLLSIKNEELGWALVKSKNNIQLKYAQKKGITLPPPIGENIKHIFTKPK